MTPINDNTPVVRQLGLHGLVAGGVEHGALVTVRPGPRSCGSFRKVSAAADLAGRFAAVASLPARPALRLVDRFA